MIKVIIPELGEGIEKVTVACWHVAVGDQIRIDDDMVELVADKASFMVPAETSGVVKEIKVGEGQEAAVGDVLAVIEVHK
jgi:pyruvate/2-oxoglutarate dehydrogenase complex dihydrolipoamide acyltransferase (E2) component